MSKASRTRHKRAKVRKVQIEARRRLPQSKRARILAALKAGWHGVAWAWKVLGVGLVLLGAMATLYFFTWRLSVTPGGSLKDKDPFKTMFILQNDGQFPVYDVTFSCFTNAVKYPNSISVEEHQETYETFDIPKLEANAQTSAPCSFDVHIPFAVITADISLTIKYRPSFYPFYKTQHFRFLAARKDDGSYLWSPIAK